MDELKKNSLPDKKESSDSRTFRYFNTMYAVALTTVALVSIISNLVVQHIISQQNNDSEIVNLAGRQRMFSQKISKLTLKIDELNYHENKAEFEETVKQWKDFHIAIASRDDKLGLQGENSSAVTELFKKIEPDFTAILQGVNSLQKAGISNDKAKIIAARKQVLKHETGYLQLMNKIVFSYADEANLKLNRLKRIETALLIIVLTILCLEALLIFNPVGKKIKYVISHLVNSEAKANALADKLREANDSLFKSAKEVHDINFALDEATLMVKTDRWGKITYANKHYCELTKYSLENLLGRTLFENRLGEEESIIYDHIRDEEKANQVWQGEIYDHAKDYSYFWLDVTLIPIVSMSGDLYQFMAIGSNVTTRKKTERQLAQIHEERLRKQEHEQKIRSISIITGQESERKRMAQEVHDGIGQMLTALKFGLESFSLDNEQEQEKINGLKDLLQSTIKETRRISSDLLPPVLQDYGLGPAIRELIAIQERTSSIPVNFEERLSFKQRLNTNVAISLYRICQESLNNALKYSNASNIKMILTNNVEHVILIIEDDGTGFDIVEAEKNSQTTESGNGLNNMRERAALVNSNLYINSRPDKGTRIFVELPIENDIFM